MRFAQFIEKYNVYISLIFAIVGVIVPLITTDSHVLYIRLTVFTLSLIILGQMIYSKKLRRKIEVLQGDITKLNSTVDDNTIEVLNRFRKTPEKNVGLSFEQIAQTIMINGMDAEIECMYSGSCVSPDGTDSFECDIYGDGSSSFADLHYVFFDLKHDAKEQHGYTSPHVHHYNKMFSVTNRFAEKLDDGDTFQLKYKCVYPGSINYGDDYYAAHVPGSKYDLKKFACTLIFMSEQPEFVEIFDNTAGGKGKFIRRLDVEGVDGKFVYRHVVENIHGVRDYVYLFRRQKGT
jgi:hypothetical protein